jgi:hypothetical protein
MAWSATPQSSTMPTRPILRRLALACALAPCALPAAALADSADGLVQPIIDSRLRSETVQQDGMHKNAEALTWRTRFGFETKPIAHLKLLVEGENTTALDSNYNNTINGKKAYPTVADPQGSQLNRLQLDFNGLPETDVVVGRQRIILNNARFIGNVGFRQHEQTFDAAMVTTRAFKPFTFTYAYIDRVHRVFGPDSPQGTWSGPSHLIQADTHTPIGDLSTYGYLLDFTNAKMRSSETWGARLTGAHAIAAGWAGTYGLEYARESNYANNPAHFAVDYDFAEIGAKKGPFAATLGVEKLGSDGVHSFQTPLATLHSFEGWAELFLTTPAKGIRDVQVRSSYNIPEPPLVQALKLTVAYHDFKDEEGEAAFGHEVDAEISAKFSEHIWGTLTTADFHGEQPAYASRSRIWAALEFKY